MANQCEIYKFENMESNEEFNKRMNSVCREVIRKDTLEDTRKFRIRKLTPKECFRLMGVDDVDIDKIQSAGISNSQQYKLAGNSIVVDCLYYIFQNMFYPNEEEVEEPTLF